MWSKIRERCVVQANFLLFFTIIYVGCKMSGRLAEKVGNVYTINHMKYNMDALWVFIRIIVIAIALTGSQGNFGLHPENRYCESIYKTLLFGMRLTILIYFLIIVVPDFGHILRETSVIQNNNWWQDPDNEPFITNISFFNALICWVLYIFFAVLLYFVIYMYMPVVLVFFCIAIMRESPGSRRQIRLHCQQRILPLLGQLIYSELNGTAFESH